MNYSTGMIIWLDDIRPVPDEYIFDRREVIHTYSVNGTKSAIQLYAQAGITDFLLDLDHDLGDYAADGGDGIKLILWLIETERNNRHYQIKLHTMNPVGRDNMKSLIDRYWS